MRISIHLPASAARPDAFAPNRMHTKLIAPKSRATCHMPTARNYKHGWIEEKNNEGVPPKGTIMRSRNVLQRPRAGYKDGSAERAHKGGALAGRSPRLRPRRAAREAMTVPPERHTSYKEEGGQN